ncbi:ATP-binding protein [Streptosporangium sp. NBC_01810]|uniref:ATP-binding protein n=1 Tax=Streptosporangium sp. NBC_01810 TaxID=2975951 RepID=UPI002DDA1F7D|nr:ATP-binding protein [Streptosporangium sp. NBC_01810]WSA23611.1 ATP-binding protein [Streptosporangium sp. NBC_01810]
MGHPYADDALLLLTELVTNSVRHSDSGRTPDGRITVAVAHHNGTLHIDVIDAGSSTGQRPRVCPDTDLDSGGGRDVDRAAVWTPAIATGGGLRATSPTMPAEDDLPHPDLIQVAPSRSSGPVSLRPCRRTRRPLGA